jgi:hypothetical protein
VTYVKALHLAKYDDPANYQLLEPHLYRRLSDGHLVAALRLELEERERAYLVLEDISMEYVVSATADSGVEANGDLSVLLMEFEGSAYDPAENLANMRRLVASVGLRVHEVIVSPHEIKLIFEREVAPGDYEVVYERWVDSGLHKRILE